MSYKEKVLDVHSSGNNCTQSMLLGFQDVTGLDMETGKAIGAGLGGGVCSGEMCGALVGAAIVLGCVFSERETDSLERAKAVNGATKECVRCFREKFGSVRCLELKKAGVTCQESIGFAAEIVEEILNRE